MSPEPINERVAALEPQVEELQKDNVEFRTFKDDMIKQMADLRGDIKTLSWKVSLITGGILIAGTQLVPWIWNKLLS